MVEIERTEIKGQGKRPRVYGHIVKFSDGTSVYYAKKKHKDIFRGGCSSISEAMLEGKAGWAIDLEILVKIRSKVQFIGVEVSDNGDKYITPVETYFKGGEFKTVTKEGRFSTKQQRVALLSKFVRSHGRIKVSEDRIEPA